MSSSGHKRSWDMSASADDWAAHPYAGAYMSMNIPIHPSPLHNSYDPSGSRQGDKDHDVKEEGSIGRESDGEDDDEDEDDDDGKPSDKKAKTGRDGKQKQKLTRGSRACIACRKIKMRCIPDETSGPAGPCRRCKAGGHECIFEESNRGKRSTRKNEALSARLAKLENALKGIGGALSSIDQPSLNSFSTALHAAVADPGTINLITSFTTPSTVPTLATAQNRTFIHSDTFVGGYGGDAAAHSMAHSSQPPLSPRLHSLPDNVLSPLGLLAEASLRNTRKGAKPGARPSPGVDDRNAGRSSGASGEGVNRVTTSDVRGQPEDGDDEGRGVASQNYFKPTGVGIHVGPPDNRLPELLTIIQREEIVDLFAIFFDHMGTHVPLMYREFHTPDLVLQRSQFLCTVICAIAARHYKAKPALHSSLSAYAKRLAFEVPSRGYKSVEVVQAYLLLALWTLGPEKTFEQDRTWMMLGMAIRMATDLNLHRKSMTSGLDTEEGRARDLEIINRERCWLHCFILDRSISAQMGKPYTIKEDYIIRKACEASWHQQKFSLPTDRPMAAYSVLQQIMSRAIDSIYSSTSTISGLRQDCDYMMVVRSAHEELRRWLVDWNKPEDAPTLTTHFEYEPRAQFYYAYHSLVLYSFGLENAIERCRMDISFFLTNVYESAARVCAVMKEHLWPKGVLPYLPDTNFVMCSYALLSLLKLLKPELRSYHDAEEAIFKLVSEMADMLEDCAADASHQPAIYAAFIREIVRKTKESRIRGHSTYPSRAGSPSAMQHMHGVGNGTIDPNLTSSAALVDHGAGPTLAEGLRADENGVYDPALLEQAAAWTNDMEGSHFQFIPQGGDMMILPDNAGPSQSLANSPSQHFASRFPGDTPAATGANAGGGAGSSSQTGWAEYLPTFLHSDGFDGWDGSMLLPGFGRGQITLGGGVLHSQFGSGIITPAQHTPSQSRMGSRAASRAQSPAS